MSEEVRVVNETTGGEKGQKLARFDLIPPRPMWEVAELYGEGAKKYADRNWERGYAWSLSIGALERHFNLFKQGEDYDAETTKRHLASVVFHALALMEFAETHPELDDRPKGDRYAPSEPEEGALTPEEFEAAILAVSGVHDLQRGEIGDDGLEAIIKLREAIEAARQHAQAEYAADPPDLHPRVYNHLGDRVA